MCTAKVVAKRTACRRSIRKSGCCGTHADPLGRDRNAVALVDRTESWAGTYDQQLQVESVEALSARYFVLRFRSPEIARETRAGQFVMMSIDDAIDPLLRRPMAFYRIHRDEGKPVGFSLLIEAIGRGTRILSTSRAGDLIRILGPLGRPFEIPAGSPGPAGEQLLVMGGVGAAPFPLLAEEMTRRGLRIRAFLGGRRAEDLLCEEDFVQLGVPVEVATDDGSRGHHGLVTSALDAYLATGSNGSTIYSCGPMAMMRAVDRIAQEKGLLHQVSLEAPMACGIGICLSCVVRVVDGDGWTYQRVCREGPVFEAGQLMWR